MVSDLNFLLIKGVKSPRKNKMFFWGNLGLINHWSLSQSRGHTTRIRRSYNKDQEVIQQESGGYTTRLRRLYNNDQEVIQQGSGGYTTRIRRLLAGFLVSVLQSASVERCFVSRMRDSQQCKKNSYILFKNFKIIKYLFLCWGSKYLLRVESWHFLLW